MAQHNWNFQGKLNENNKRVITDAEILINESDKIGASASNNDGKLNLNITVPNYLKNIDITIPLLRTEWVAQDDGDYVQTVTIDGVDSGCNPLVILSYAGDEPTEDENYAYSCIKAVTTDTDVIKFTASELPPISFTVIAKSITGAVENSTAIDVTALVSRIAELESEVNGLNNSLISATKFFDLTAPNGDWNGNFWIRGELRPSDFHRILFVNPVNADGVCYIPVVVTHTSFTVLRYSDGVMNLFRPDYAVETNVTFRIFYA